MERLNGIYRKEAGARAPQVVYVDMWKLLDGGGGTYDADLRQSDGVHLSDDGAFRSGDVILARSARTGTCRGRTGDAAAGAGCRRRGPRRAVRRDAPTRAT